MTPRLRVTRYFRLWQLRTIELLLAVGVLLGTWIEVESPVTFYPAWIYLGDATVPTFVILPTALAFALIAELLTIHTHRRGLELSVAHLIRGALAVLTLLAVLYAIVDLNLAQTDVFFAGFLPLVAGFLLAVSVLFFWGKFRSIGWPSRDNND